MSSPALVAFRGRILANTLSVEDQAALVAALDRIIPTFVEGPIAGSFPDDEQNAREWFAVLYAIAELGTVPPDPHPVVRSVAFSFDTASPMALPDLLLVGSTVLRAGVVITTAFDDPAATLEIGTAATPDLLLGATDSTPGDVGQYESQNAQLVSVGGALQLTISPGASTQGAGFVFYEITTT